MLSFDDPLTLLIVLALAAWGGLYAFKLVRLGVQAKQRDADEALEERTQRLLQRYRRNSVNRPK